MQTHDDRARLDELQQLAILDTLPEARFDNAVGLASTICETPMAAVSFVDAERQWFKARVGIDAPQTPRSVAFCDHAIRGDQMMVVRDARDDARFQHNPLVTDAPHIRFYAGRPLKGPGGHRVGTLCVIDRTPRELSDRQSVALEALAQSLEAELQLRKALADARRLQQIQARVSGFLVHDLRNPIAAVKGFAKLIGMGEDRDRCVSAIQGAADDLLRMSDAFLDIYRHAAGELTPRIEPVGLRTLIDEVVERQRPRTGDRSMRIDVRDAVLWTDRGLLARVLTNLIENAAKYSPDDSEIAVSAFSTGEDAWLTVVDQGSGIEEEARDRIFDLYGMSATGRDALPEHRSKGMGLAFCKSAVNAMGGSIEVAPNRPRGSIFRVHLPQPGVPGQPE